MTPSSKTCFHGDTPIFMSTWAPRIWPDDHGALERLARYIIRACFSSERMVYIPAKETSDGIAKVFYTLSLQKMA